VTELLECFRDGSQELLRYVGLTENSELCGVVLVAAQPKACLLNLFLKDHQPTSKFNHP
jgi:hypothetical protein